MEVLEHPARHKTWAAGRGSGKSTAASVWVSEGALRYQGEGCIIVAQTYGAVKRRYWKELRAILEPWIARASESELRIDLTNGSWVQLFGADRPQNLRGMHLARAAIDEEDELDPDLFDEVVAPMLTVRQSQGRGGESLHIGTPKGFGPLFRHYTAGQEGRAGWASWQTTYRDAPHIDPAIIEARRQEMDEGLWRQEYEASFELRTGAVFSMFSRAEHVKPTAYDPRLPVYAGEDFNVGCQVTVLFHLVPSPAGPRMHFFREVVSRDAWTQDHVARMLSVLGEYGITPAPDSRSEVVVYCDATGESRSRVGPSDVHMLKKAGFTVRHRKSNPHVEDRLNAVRRMLKAADGTVRMQFDPSMRLTIESFEKLCYRKGSNPPDVDKTQGYDHATDAAGYPTEYLFPLKTQGYALVGGVRR